MSSAKFIFQAVRGIQANMEYYISMVPLETIPKLFLFSEEELPVEIRTQRTLNKSRIPEMRDYILNNPNSYVFSSLTVSVDGDIEFIPISDKNEYVGQISIPMSAQFLINDGQHRRAAIEAALRNNPKLKYEHISVVFYSDLGLKRSQQMFSDLNKYAIRPTKSLNILFDHRDEFSVLVKDMIEKVDIFIGLVEKERTTIPNRSKALFTLSGIFHGTEQLLHNLDMPLSAKKDIAQRFWNKVAENVEEWRSVKNGTIKSSELRKHSVCAHSITMMALGYAGGKLISQHMNDWEQRIPKLSTINWSKDNSKAWDGTVVINGYISASRASQQALSTYIENVLLNGQV